MTARFYSRLKLERPHTHAAKEAIKTIGLVKPNSKDDTSHRDFNQECSVVKWEISLSCLRSNVSSE